MVEILCPHCDEEIGLDNDAIGEFSCPHCDEDFTWGGLSGDGTSTDIYNSKSFWIGFGIPNLFIILAWGSAILIHEYRIRFNFLGIFDSGDAIGLLHIVSFLSWITILIYGIRIKNKAMWKGSLVGIAAAPAFLILGIVWYIQATDWSMFQNNLIVFSEGVSENPLQSNENAMGLHWVAANATVRIIQLLPDLEQRLH